MRVLLPFVIAVAITPAEAKETTAYEERQFYVCSTGIGSWWERGRCPATPIPWNALKQGPGEGDSEAVADAPDVPSDPAPSPPTNDDPVDQPERCE